MKFDQKAYWMGPLRPLIQHRSRPSATPCLPESFLLDPFPFLNLRLIRPSDLDAIGLPLIPLGLSGKLLLDLEVRATGSAGGGRHVGFEMEFGRNV
jgi:hypothetical protein